MVLGRWLLRLVPPGIWLLAAVMLGAWQVYEMRVAQPRMSWMGLPRAQFDWSTPNSWFRVLRNQGFLVGYSDWRGNPLWVCYRLSPARENGPALKRPSRFYADWRALNRVRHEDYAGSGYDHGHMAPNHAISVLYGREAQEDTFLLTNITPQRPNLNRRLWERLEEAELDHFAPRAGQVWVYTGPVFEAPLERLKASWRVEIPDAFYKIVVAPDSRKAIAFIMPQNVEGNEPLDHYLVSVDSVERRTGLDFFHELDDAAENRMEAEVDPDFWRLQDVAHKAGRYHRAEHQVAGSKP